MKKILFVLLAFTAVASHANKYNLVSIENRISALESSSNSAQDNTAILDGISYLKVAIAEIQTNLANNNASVDQPKVVAANSGASETTKPKAAATEKQVAADNSASDASQSEVVAAAINQYETALKEAKAEQKKAKKAGFEWRDIGKFLKEAGKLYKKGDVEGAMKLVAQAKDQALLGQQQAKDQANAGPNFN